MATQEFQVAYDPQWITPLVVMSDNIPKNRIIIPDPPAETTLIFQITTNGVTFPDAATQWFLGESLEETVSPDRKTLTILIAPPTSTIQPYSFSLIANAPAPNASAGTINGLRTRGLYVTLAELQPPSSTLLKYHTDTGAFEIAGINLKPGKLLVFSRSGTMGVALRDQNGQPSADLRFSTNAIQWLSGGCPAWMSWTWPSLSRDTIQLTDNAPAGMGLAAPFRFVIEYKGLPITSPDPIIVNAPIGDGSDG